MENVLQIYSIKDQTAGSFGPLFEAENDQVAARNYRLVMQKIDPQFVPEYDLYQLGEVNTKTGEIIQDSLPRKVNVVVFIPNNKSEVVNE